MVRVRVPPETEELTFRLPTCLRVGQIVPLMTRLVRTWGTHPYGIRDQALLMVVEGEGAGRVLDEDLRVGELVLRGLLTDGSTLVLV